MVMVAGHYNRIAVRIDAADDTNMSASATAHYRDGTDLRARDTLTVARK